MVDAFFEKASIFKDLINSFKDLIEDVNLIFDETGMKITSLDTSHVSIIYAVIPKNDFTSYKCKGTVVLGLKIGSISLLMKCSKSGDSLRMKAKSDPGDVEIIFEQGSKTSTYTLKVMDIDCETLEIPETVYDCIVTMPSAEYSILCQKLNILGDCTTITIKKKLITFFTKGDMGEGTLGFKSDKKEVFII